MCICWCWCSHDDNGDEAGGGDDGGCDDAGCGVSDGGDDAGAGGVGVGGDDVCVVGGDDNQAGNWDVNPMVSMSTSAVCLWLNMKEGDSYCDSMFLLVNV